MLSNHSYLPFKKALPCAFYLPFLKSIQLKTCYISILYYLVLVPLHKGPNSSGDSLRICPLGGSLDNYIPSRAFFLFASALPIGMLKWHTVHWLVVGIAASLSLWQVKLYFHCCMYAQWSLDCTVGPLVHVFFGQLPVLHWLCSTGPCILMTSGPMTVYVRHSCFLLHWENTYSEIGAKQHLKINVTSFVVQTQQKWGS